ncbi:uncharacterized protein LOC124993291 [Sciurus carolinensis]|uniref:uncharacterized protein LOC124993291 n=1 Tax=Sciurus carolinensis TaxID=30640 RepID=UPI001FB3B1BD|nr:uncharacterized protein LOC124993291 [Sciurus carolinensis]
MHTPSFHLSRKNTAHTLVASVCPWPPPLPLRPPILGVQRVKTDAVPGAELGAGFRALLCLPALPAEPAQPRRTSSWGGSSCQVAAGAPADAESCPGGRTQSPRRTVGRGVLDARPPLAGTIRSGLVRQRTGSCLLQSLRLLFHPLINNAAGEIPCHLVTPPAASSSSASAREVLGSHTLPPGLRWVRPVGSMLCPGAVPLARGAWGSLWTQHGSGAAPGLVSWVGTGPPGGGGFSQGLGIFGILGPTASCHRAGQSEGPPPWRLLRFRVLSLRGPHHCPQAVCILCCRVHTAHPGHCPPLRATSPCPCRPLPKAFAQLSCPHTSRLLLTSEVPAWPPSAHSLIHAPPPTLHFGTLASGAGWVAPPSGSLVGRGGRKDGVVGGF